MELLAKLKKWDECSISLSEWVHTYRELRIGTHFQPFSLTGHEYMREWLEKPFPITIFEKAAQMGVSEYAVSFALWFADTRMATVIYFFPNDGDVEDFSNTRVKPIIQRSDHLMNKIADINMSMAARKCTTNGRVMCTT